MRQKTKNRLKKVGLVGGILLAGCVAFVLYVEVIGPTFAMIQQTKEARANDLNEAEIMTAIETIEEMLETVGFSDELEWQAIANCGPTDAFMGYSVKANGILSLESAERLRPVASDAGYRVVDREGYPDYTILGPNNSWDIFVIINEEIAPMRIDIDAQDPYSFPRQYTFCG